MMAVASMPLFNSSCKDEDKDKKQEEEEPYVDSDDYSGIFSEYYDAESFYDKYCSYKAAKLLVDFRSEEEYLADHLKGAVNLPATRKNTQDDKSQWCVDLLNTFPTNTSLFFYGPSDYEMQVIVAGRASRLGYGKENTIIFTGKYDNLKKYFGVE